MVNLKIYLNQKNNQNLFVLPLFLLLLKNTSYILYVIVVSTLVEPVLLVDVESVVDVGLDLPCELSVVDVVLCEPVPIVDP